MPVNETRHYLVALAHTNEDTLKATATANDLWTALCGLWDEVRVSSHGRAVAVPLMGQGQSGVGLDPRALLQLSLVSIVYQAKESKICERVHIVLHHDLYGEIDLRDLIATWG